MNVNKNRSFFEWINYIKEFRFDVQKNHFKNIVYVAKKLGILNSNMFIYIVGGTNGKGTTCYILEKILLKHGYKVGLYTSPHLFRYTERVRINGVELEEDLHIISFNNVEIARGTLFLTYYDFITLSALYLFKHSKLDIIILEVGLGGRLDATNVITPNISVITNISLDHIEILGNNRHLISIEKIGILRSRKIAIISETNFSRVAKKIVYKNNVKIRLIHQDWFYKKYNNFWSFMNKYHCFLNLPLPNVPLVNAATALAAISESEIVLNKYIIKNCFQDISIPGRFQVLSYNPKIILDVAHNSCAVNYLFGKLVNMKVLGKIYVIIGLLKGKDILNIVTPLVTIVSFWYCVRLNTKRSISPRKIVQFLPINSSEICVNIEYAWRKVQNIVSINDVILIFGSFFTVREIYKFLIN
ncbi:MAG: bifunctional tetrahydrofolate synthase/dihydrofolate synthase [Buchnera aphidicola (Nurudea yanoniella)]